MNKKNLILEILAVCAVLLLGVIALRETTPPSLGDAGTPNFIQSTTDASSTCGQYSQTSFTVGPLAASTSTGTGFYTVSINGTNVTSTSENTSTAATTVATAIATAITAESSTLGGLTASAASNVVNVTSTSWGAYLTPSVSSPQNGLTLSDTNSGPATEFIQPNGVRQYLDATTQTPTGTYVCLAPNCSLATGHFLPSGGDYAPNYPNIYVGGVSCIGNVSGTVVSYTTK